MGKNKSASNLVNVIDFNNDRIAFISGSTTLMSISSSGAITTTGVISGSNAASASFALNAGLLNNKDSAEFTSTGSFNAYTSSNDATVTSVAAAAVSAVAGVNALAARTSSYTTTSSFNSYTSSNDATVNCVSSTATSALVGVGTLASKTGSYATTGSNVFDGGQYLSSSFNPTGFSTTASLYTDGGLRVSKDAYISGTLYLNNVTVYGTQSVCYITSSQLNISSNLISVNTSTPSVRFGGLAVYDSGSTGLTGSILWDSENNHWVYSNPSGSSYSGGMFISGPRTSTLGSETGTTSCMLLAGQGGDHLTSSLIYHSSTVTCIPNTLIGSTVCSTMLNAGCIGIGTQTPKSYSSLTSAGQIISLNNIGIDTGQSFRINNYYNSGTGTDRTISNGYAVSIGLDSSNGSMIFNTSTTCVAADNNITVTERFRITSTGVACFANTICAGGFYTTGNSCFGGRLSINTNIDSEVPVRIGAIGNTTDTITCSTALRLSTINNTAGQGVSLAFTAGTTKETGIILAAENTSGQNGDFVIRIYSGGANYPERFRVTSRGNIGIGTTIPICTNLIGSVTIVKCYNGDTPTSPTAQTYDINQSNLYLFGRNAGLTMVGNQNEESIIAFGNPYAYYIGGIRMGMGSGVAGGDMVFQTCGTCERIRISSDGSIGFNNSIIGSRSFVFKALTGRPIVIEAIENAGVHSMFFRPNNSGYNLVSSNYLSGGTYLPLSLSARENNGDVVLATNGNVGIGIGTPSQKLHINSGGFLQTAANSSWYRNIFERNVTSWDNVVGFSPQSSPQYTYGYINITASAYSNGTSAGGVVTSRWYYSITNNSISVSVVGTDITTGSQAPAVRLTVSGGTIYVQVQSSNGSVAAYTTVFVDAMLASGYVNGTYWIIS